MHDDVLLHLSSNSNQSDPSLPLKLAKLEARMAGKPTSSSSMQNAWQGQVQDSTSVALSVGNNLAPVAVTSTDSEEDGGGDFMIQANPQKRKFFSDSADSAALQSEEIKLLDQSNSREDTSKRRTSRGRGRGGGTKGRGKTKDVPSLPMTSFDSHSEAVSKETQATGDGDGKRQLQQDEILGLNARCASLCEDLEKARQMASEYQQNLQAVEKELKETKEAQQQREQTRLKAVSDLLIAVAKGERHEARLRVRQDSFRLGNVSVMRAGTVISEVWEEGQALKDIQTRLRSLMEQKEVIEKNRKQLKRRQGDKTEASEGDEEEHIAMEEMYRSRLSGLKREEDAALRDRDRYELEKACHIRELKRIRDEDGSRFNHYPILNKRYALLNLLGKGGFSEVYKAYDLVDYRYVACKLHGLNMQWSEEKKQSYIRHAIREYNIHKVLNHSHIVRLWDTFEIDHNTFCTVLEYCGGKDLDAVLKATPILPEREARSIMVQIFSGLTYLNKRSQRIIHYDLKPGNVLFDETGVAKMTDFGLSKIVEEGVHSQGMELTSQGAGTYWYLPPECFEVNRTPMISSKVDVWSAGVLFYQMLFGKRPFGHDQSQERILREDTIMKANKVEFPSRPAVSSEAKDFIRRCLSYNQAERPDVLTAAQDPYLSYVKRKP